MYQNLLELTKIPEKGILNFSTRYGYFLRYVGLVWQQDTHSVTQ